MVFEKNSGFRVEEEGDKGKIREIRKGNISFSFILWLVIPFSLQKEACSKNEISFQNWHVLTKRKNWVSDKGAVDDAENKETAFTDQV